MSIRNRRRQKERARSAVKSVRSSQLVWYFIVPLVLLLACTAPWQRLVGNFFAPYLMLGNVTGNALADQTLLLRSRRELASEVERLRKQNFQLAMELNETRPAAAENRQLRTALNLREEPGYDYLACSVILRDPWLWENGFTIDRGSKDGLKPGWAVITPAPDREGRVILLGVIESVSYRTSRVISVINPEFRISAALPESGTRGFINAGEFAPSSGGMASVGFLPANRTFILNELIYTTGFESSIPGGLLIGSLDSIEATALPFGNRLYRRGVMRPAGEFEKIRTVIVARVKNPVKTTE